MRKKKRQKKSKQNNKLSIVIVTAILFVVGATVFMSLSNITNQPSNTNTVSNANEIKSEAIKLINSDSKKAKELFQQALAIYQSSKDTNNIIDTESLIYLVDHKK